MTVNRVWLIGLIARAPRPADDELGAGQITLVAAIRRGSPDVVDRFRVRSLTDPIPPVGTEVLVEGSLLTVGHQESTVLAARIVTLVAAPAMADDDVAEPTHQRHHESPVAHDRRGHWRTLERGSHRERLVWVRATAVGRHDPA